MLSQNSLVTGKEIDSLAGDPLFTGVNSKPLGTPAQYNWDFNDKSRLAFNLRSGSAAIDRGSREWPTRVTAKSGNVITVAQALWFYYEMGNPEVGNIYIYDDDHSRARIIAINYQTNQITLDNASDFNVGEGVTWIDFKGSAPDLGALEYSFASNSYCGDSSCSGTENCQTCPEDCGDCPPSGNLITNPSFEQDKTSWSFFNDASSDANQFSIITSDKTHGTKAARIAPASVTGTNIQLLYKDIILKPSTGYRLTFDAKSNTGRDFSLYLHKDVSPHTNYGLNNHLVNLSQNWQSFTVNFTTQNFTAQVSDARLRLWFSGFAQAGDIYYFDNFSLTENTGDTAPPAAPTGLSVR
jgi:hypothetical protein